MSSASTKPPQRHGPAGHLIASVRGSRTGSEGTHRRRMRRALPISTSPKSESEFPLVTHVRDTRRRGRFRRRARARRHHRAVPDPGPHHPRCPRRPRRLRQGQDRLGQDARVRAPLLERIGQGGAEAAPGARARPRPASSPTRSRTSSRRWARSAARRVAAVYGGASMDRQIDALHKGVDVVVATPGPPHRPPRTPGAVASPTWRCSSSTRPTGWPTRLHAPGPEAAAPHRVRASDDAVLGHPRRRRRQLVNRYMHDPVCHEVESAEATSTRWRTASCTSTRWTR